MGNICWIASYPKSGNTWMRAFIENYIQNRNSPVDINALFLNSTAEARAERFQVYAGQGRATTDMETEEICAIRPLVQADIARQAQGTVFVKTHNFLGEYRGCPLHSSAVTSGAIYVVRNPLDVCISMARYFDYTVDEAIDYLSEEMTGTPNEVHHVPQVISSWSANVESWTGTPDDQILVVRYEDMLDQALKVFRKVESFLGMKKDPARLRKAIRFSSFGQMKAQESKSGFVEKHENANAFFRQGRKGQWREQLTSEQVARVVEKHAAQMARFKYLP
ncbi:MAG: sulfotransferase domain-containing protein [Xanthomonadales bacterium]|nr:sulfotransferase domain-containing protein [Xanthomonadales bacterium]NNL94305.1 sulfotransferase domain-containing protein [Xanthomonadales bacterium]